MTAPPPQNDDPSDQPGAPGPSRPKSRRNDAVGLLHDAYAQFRTFERAREGRMVAGVCAGVGRRLGIDPVVIRVVIAVLGLVSGAGLVLYGAGWLLLPEEGRGQSIAERLSGRRGESNGAIVVGVGAIVALAAMSMLPWGEDWWGPVLVVGIIAGLVALARRRPDDSAADPLSYLNAPSGAAAASAPPEPFRTPRESASAEPAGPLATEADRAAQADQSTAAEPPLTEAQSPETDRPLETSGAVPSAPPRTWTQHAATPPPPSFWDQPDPLGLEGDPEPYAPPAPVPAAPKPAKAIDRPRSVLFPLTVGFALLSLFVLAAASGAGEPIPLVFWVAAPLGVIGLGLLAGTWYGRAGGLIALGIPLAIALVPLGVIDAVAKGGSWPQGDAEFGDYRYAPASVAEIEPTYRHGAGEVTLILTEVNFTDKDAVDVSIESGVGDLTIILPDEVDVDLSGSVGLGDASVFGESVAGDPSPRFDLRDDGTDGPGGGRLTLNTKLGLGSLEITRGDPVQPADIPPPESPERPEQPEQPEQPERPR